MSKVRRSVMNIEALLIENNPILRVIKLTYYGDYRILTAIIP